MVIVKLKDDFEIESVAYTCFGKVYAKEVGWGAGPPLFLNLNSNLPYLKMIDFTRVIDFDIYKWE